MASRRMAYEPALTRRQFLASAAALAAGQALAGDPPDEMQRAIDAWYDDNNALDGKGRRLPGAGIAKACLRKIEPDFDGTGAYALGNTADGLPRFAGSMLVVPYRNGGSSLLDIAGSVLPDNCTQQTIHKRGEPLQVKALRTVANLRPQQLPKGLARTHECEHTNLRMEGDELTLRACDGKLQLTSKDGSSATLGASEIWLYSGPQQSPNTPLVLRFEQQDVFTCDLLSRLKTDRTHITYDLTKLQAGQLQATHRRMPFYKGLDQTAPDVDMKYVRVLLSPQQFSCCRLGANTRLLSGMLNHFSGTCGMAQCMPFLGDVAKAIADGFIKTGVRLEFPGCEVPSLTLERRLYKTGEIEAMVFQWYEANALKLGVPPLRHEIDLKDAYKRGPATLWMR